MGVRFTRVQINSWFLAILLAALQIYMIWSIEQNGGVSALLQDDLETVALFFGPTAALAWSLRTIAGQVDEHCPLCTHERQHVPHRAHEASPPGN